MGRQEAITKTHGIKLPKVQEPAHLKYAFRSGVLDIHKRELLVKHFDLKPKKCFVEYQTMKKSLGMKFLSFTDQLGLGNKSLYYDYLTAFGRAELDFMLVYFMRNMGVERVQFCSHLVNLLLIFMPPWEAFAVMKELI